MTLFAFFSPTCLLTLRIVHFSVKWRSHELVSQNKWHTVGEFWMSATISTLVRKTGVEETEFRSTFQSRTFRDFSCAERVNSGLNSRLAAAPGCQFMFSRGEDATSAYKSLAVHGNTGKKFFSLTSTCRVYKNKYL